MIKQILKLLEGKRVVITVCSLDKRAHFWGLCDYVDRELFVSKRLCERNRIRTLIHESVHFLYPQFSEVTVLAIENDVYTHLTQDEYTRLAALVKTT